MQHVVVKDMLRYSTLLSEGRVHHSALEQDHPRPLVLDEKDEGSVESSLDGIIFSSLYLRKPQKIKFFFSVARPLRPYTSIPPSPPRA